MLYWREQLKKVTERYSRVLMLGDSMGATAALLFSDLATSVQAFTPQVSRLCTAGDLGRLGCPLHQGSLVSA